MDHDNTQEEPEESKEEPGQEPDEVDTGQEEELDLRVLMNQAA